VCLMILIMNGVRIFGLIWELMGGAVEASMGLVGWKAVG
jgi:hypothetical protein